ncbi:MAG: Dph6-related ATP pyrophosphatase, partial [Polyangiales bacterium]
VAIPDPCPNAIYERVMGEAMAAARAQGITHVAFGDLFLEDIRAYRESKLAGSGISPLFPLFGADTRALAREMIAGGLRAVIVTSSVPGLCGKRFEEITVPEGIDPCGENGEFHTFAVAGPMFSRAIDVEVGPVFRRGDYDHVDLRQAQSASTNVTA